MVRKIAILALFLIGCINIFSAQHKVNVVSPDRQAVFKFGLTAGQAEYSVITKIIP